MNPDDLKKKRIGVLMGGISSEREVSLETGAGVLSALTELGYQASAIDWAPRSDPAGLLAAAGIEVVWNALHGTYGEDGAAQGLLQCLGLPYTGSGILASALAMDKVACKRMFDSHGLPTPAWQVLSSGPDLAGQLEALTPPVVIKPAHEGSSVGVTIVDDRALLADAVARAQEHKGPTLCETYIDGAELHVGLLDDQVLGTIEVRPAVDFYDYEAKYKRDDTTYLIPPEVDAAAVERAETLALDAYRAVGCLGHARVDLRIDQEGAPFLLEVNTLPGMTSHSLLPKIAAHRGISYAELCERILQSAHLE